MVSGGDDEKEMEKNTWKRIDERNGGKRRNISWKRKNCCRWADGWRYIRGSSIRGPNGIYHIHYIYLHLPKKVLLVKLKKPEHFHFLFCPMDTRVGPNLLYESPRMGMVGNPSCATSQPLSLCAREKVEGSVEKKEWL